MNCSQLVGRLVADPDIRYTDGGSSIARFRIAVDRRFKSEKGADADFIPCVSYGKTAEFVEKYFKKGNRIGIIGRIQTGNYEKDGKTVYTMDVVAENVEFVESKGNVGAGAAPAKKADDFMAIPDEISDEELPFN